MVDRLPLEEVGDVGPAKHERKGEQRSNDEHDAKTRIPLQHARPPSLSYADEAIVSLAPGQAITRTGDRFAECL